MLVGYLLLSCGKDRAEFPAKCGEFPSVMPLRMADADRNTHGIAADAAAEKDPIASEDAQKSEELQKIMLNGKTDLAEWSCS